MTKKPKSTINLTKEVIKRIQKDKVKMRPHFYFVLGSFLLGTGIAATILFSTFLVNLISFRLKTQGHFEYLRFGRPGLFAFLKHFPWPILLLIVIGVAGGIVIVRKLDVSYKKNLWGIIAALVGFILVFGLLIEKIGFNNKAAMIRPLKPFYNTNELGDQVIQGRFSSFGSSSIKFIKPNGEVVVLDLSENMIKEQEFMMFNNDDLKVFGSWGEGRFLMKDYRPKQLHKK
jgi:hypothetical protein